jgi:hypothetical protein
MGTFTTNLRTSNTHEDLRLRMMDFEKMLIRRYASLFTYDCSKFDKSNTAFDQITGSVRGTNLERTRATYNKYAQVCFDHTYEPFPRR